MSFRIRAGDLDRTIVIMRETVTLDAHRAKVSTWTPLVTLRAKAMEASLMDALRTGGSSVEDSRTFLCRWTDGITTDDRVSYAGALFTIASVSELGRRVAMSIKCQAINAGVVQ